MKLIYFKKDDTIVNVDQFVGAVASGETGSVVGLAGVAADSRVFLDNYTVGEVFEVLTAFTDDPRLDWLVT